MDSQRNFDKKFLVARNYRIIREFRSKSQDDVSRETTISKQNVSLWENLKGNPGKGFIDELSKYLRVPTDLFYRDGLTKEYLENHFSDDNITDMPKLNGGNENLRSAEEMYRDLVERNTEYRIVPKTILDGEYRIMLESELTDRKKLYDEAIASKNKLILQLEKEIDDLRSGRVVINSGVPVSAEQGK